MVAHVCLSAAGVVEQVLELHQRSQHIVQQVVVGENSFQLPDLLQQTGREVRHVQQQLPSCPSRHDDLNSRVCMLGLPACFACQAEVVHLHQCTGKGPPCWDKRHALASADGRQQCRVVLCTVLQALSSALVETVSVFSARQPSTYADRCVAVVHVLAVVKEGLYVKVLRRLHFNFRQQGLPHNTASTAAAAAHR